MIATSNPRTGNPYSNFWKGLVSAGVKYAISPAVTYTGMDGKLYVHVNNSKGGRPREVPVLPGREDDVRAVVAEREQGERVFARIPGHLDVHSYRRLFAQALYLYYAPGRTLPSAEGRLKCSDYDRSAAQKVSDTNLRSKRQF